jgi:hypothetical protein
MKGRTGEEDPEIGLLEFLNPIYHISHLSANSAIDSVRFGSLPLPERVIPLLSSFFLDTRQLFPYSSVTNAALVLPARNGRCPSDLIPWSFGQKVDDTRIIRVESKRP